MAIYRLLQNSVFGPDEIETLTQAYEDALRATGLVDRDDPVTELVAEKIIAITRTGERDAKRMAALALHQLGVPITVLPMA